MKNIAKINKIIKICMISGFMILTSCNTNPENQEKTVNIENIDEKKIEDIELSSLKNDNSNNEYHANNKKERKSGDTHFKIGINTTVSIKTGGHDKKHMKVKPKNNQNVEIKEVSKKNLNTKVKKENDTLNSFKPKSCVENNKYPSSPSLSKNHHRIHPNIKWFGSTILGIGAGVLIGIAVGFVLPLIGHVIFPIVGGCAGYSYGYRKYKKKP